MSISKDRRELYPDMSHADQVAVDNAYEAVAHSLRESGFTCANDDRAENLVGAIARYVEESRR